MKKVLIKDLMIIDIKKGKVLIQLPLNNDLSNYKVWIDIDWLLLSNDSKVNACLVIDTSINYKLEIHKQDYLQSFPSILYIPGGALEKQFAKI